MLAVVVLTGGIVTVLVLTRPEPPASEPGQTGTLVRTEPVEAMAVRPLVEAHGSVRAIESVEVHPQVSGRIEEVAAALRPGGRVRRGEVLLRLETADQAAALARARAAVVQARAELALERGRREVAREELQSFRDDYPTAPGETDSALVLREPQIAAAKSRLADAEAQAQMAQLDLDRTVITAPFAAVVQSERAAPGRLVGPETSVATLVEDDAVWVETAVPVDRLGYVTRPGQNGDGGAPARVSWDTGPEPAQRDGRVVAVYPDLTDEGRLARVLVEVPQPPPDDRDSPRLLLGSYVAVAIEAAEERRLTRVPRSAVHNGEEVFVYADGELDIVRPEIVWRDTAAVYVADGLDDGAQVVVSALAAPVDGMPLRRETGRGDTELQSTSAAP